MKEHKVLYPIYKMNRYQFINYTKEDELKWINYCEILIDRNGDVILAVPSHVEAIINYIAYKEKKSNKKIKDLIKHSSCLPIEWCVDKYGIIAVWYNGYMYSTYKKITKSQLKTLKLLRENKLINDTYNRPATAYCDYIDPHKKNLSAGEMLERIKSIF